MDKCQNNLHLKVLGYQKQTDSRDCSKILLSRFTFALEVAKKGDKNVLPSCSKPVQWETKKIRKSNVVEGTDKKKQEK